MAFHQFGIMECEPERGERFDRCEPERYGCIRVRDDLIDELLPPLRMIRTFWQTTDLPARGLDEAGITLIPPESIEQMEAVIGACPQLSAIAGLLAEAKRTRKWLIHFGI